MKQQCKQRERRQSTVERYEWKPLWKRLQQEAGWFYAKLCYGMTRALGESPRESLLGDLHGKWQSFVRVAETDIQEVSCLVRVASQVTVEELLPISNRPVTKVLTSR
jgi:hypothetical protein